MWIFIFLRKWFFLILCSIQPTFSINIQRDSWELKIVDKLSFIKISQNVARFLLFKLALEYRYTAITTLVSLSSVQSLSRVQLFVTPWTTARQASLSITNFWRLPKPVSIELVIPSHHLIFCHPFLLLPSIFPNLRVFSNESAPCITWPKYWFQLQHQSFQWIFRTDFL